MTCLASRRFRLALVCGAVGVGLFGVPGAGLAQPPVTIPLRGLPEPDSNVTEVERMADWSNYHRSGWQKMDRGWFDSAEREFLGSIRAARRLSGKPQTYYLSQSYYSLAWALEQQGKARAAEPLARWVVTVWRTEHGDASSITARAINLVAMIDLDLGQWADAETLLRPLLATGPGSAAGLDKEQARGASLLGLALASAHRYTEAEAEYQRAITRREALATRDAAALGDDYNNLAWCQIEQRKWVEARGAMTQALSLLESSRGADDPTVARALDGLARIDADQGDLGAAESKLLRSLSIYQAGGVPLQARLADALRRYSTLLDRMNRPRAAEAARARLAGLAAAPATPAPPTPGLTPPPPPRGVATSSRR